MKGVHDDSRRVSEDWIFVARNSKGERYVQEALGKGAIVITTKEIRKENVYVCTDGEEALHTLIALFYPRLWEGMVSIAVSGTNGKSSCAYFLYQCLSHEMPCLWIGTHHILCPYFEEESAHTTPSLCELARIITAAKQAGVRALIMEVSSHAIAQKRISALRYDYILYTNIHSDHLDYHLCEAHYRYTKYALRSYLKPKGRVIVNHDDPRQRPLYRLLSGQCVTYGTQLCHFYLHAVEERREGIAFAVNEQHYESGVFGRFQAMNLAGVITVCTLWGMRHETLQAAVKGLKPLAGRMQKVWEHPLAIIDYAHTASACLALYRAVCSLPHHQIITVIGCGGERDVEKRAQMGAIASVYSDLCIFTSDNPRNEPLAQIFAGMRKRAGKNVMIFEERAHAIKFAVKNSGNDDIILVVGKGDEHRQLIRGVSTAFHDEEVLCRALREKEERA